MSRFIYDILAPQFMMLLCYLTASIHLWLGIHNRRKVWPRFIKGFNWILLGTVYLMDWLLNPEAVEIRVYFRVALALLFISEIAYHADDLTDMVQHLKHRIWRNG